MMVWPAKRGLSLLRERQSVGRVKDKVLNRWDQGIWDPDILNRLKNNGSSFRKEYMRLNENPELGMVSLRDQKPLQY